jgi:hypothetical protein
MAFGQDTKYLGKATMISSETQISWVFTQRLCGIIQLSFLPPLLPHYARNNRRRPLMKTKVYTAALAYALITGLSFLFGKIGLISVNPLDLLAYRFTAAFLAVLFLLLFRLVKVNYSSTRVMRSIPLALLYIMLP